MDSEGKFWFGIWSAIIAGTVATVMVCVAGYTANNKAVLDAIAKAPDPQAAMCAYLTTTQDSKSERCAIIASQHK